MSNQQPEALQSCEEALVSALAAARHEADLAQQALDDLLAVTAERDALRDELSALRAQEPVGWKLVPVEPTQEMVENGRWSGCGDVLLNDKWARIECYSRMLAAAPQPPVQAQQRGPLTDEEIARMWMAGYSDGSGQSMVNLFARAVERAHGIQEQQ